MEVTTTVGFPPESTYADYHAVQQWLAYRVTAPDSLVFPLELRADRDVRRLTIDGEGQDFVVIGDALSWVADTKLGDRHVEIHARNARVDEIALVTIPSVLDQYCDPGGST